MSNLQDLQTLAEARRSIYALNDQLPVDKDQVVDLVEHAILHTPSAFNSQSTRLVVLFGEDHKKLWQITEDTLRKIVNDDERFKGTEEKLNGFKAGALGQQGTVARPEIVHQFGKAGPERGGIDPRTRQSPAFDESSQNLIDLQTRPFHALCHDILRLLGLGAIRHELRQSASQNGSAKVYHGSSGIVLLRAE